MTWMNYTPIVVTIVVPSLFCFAAGLFFGVGLFFDGSWRPLGLMILGVGTVPSWLLNVLCWHIRYRPRWLRILLTVQTLPAIIFIIWFFAYFVIS